MMIYDDRDLFRMHDDGDLCMVYDDVLCMMIDICDV